MFRSNITRRFGPEVATMIAFVEESVVRDLPYFPDARYARDLFLTSLIVSDEDGNAKMADTISAASWMTQQGRLTWERREDETIVRYEECLN